MPESGLTRDDAIAFQQLMRAECGVELTLEEAWSRASQLVILARMLIRPIPEDPEVQTSEHLPRSPVEC